MSNRRAEIRPSLRQPDLVKSLPSPEFRDSVTVAFKHAAIGTQFCLSECEKRSVREAADCLRKLTTMQWIEVLKSGGGQKTGLGYTAYNDHALKGVSRPTGLSPDIQIVGLRSGKKGRLFGYYWKERHAFQILWFDPNHKIVPV